MAKKTQLLEQKTLTLTRRFPSLEMRDGTVGHFPGLHGVSGEGDGGEPGDVADQADE